MIPALNTAHALRPIGIVTDPVSFVAAGAIVYGTTSLAPAYPTVGLDDAVFMVIGIKPQGVSATVPTGWSTLVAITGGTGSVGGDTGQTNLMILRKTTVAGTESGTVGVTVTGASVCWAQIIAYRKPVGYSWSISGATGADTTANATWSITCSSDPGFKNKDMCLIAGIVPTDLNTGASFSAHSISATGATFGSITEIAEAQSSLGNDIGGYTGYCAVTGGPSSAAPVITATWTGTTTNQRGPGAVLRIRAVYPSPPTDFNPATKAIVGWFKASAANVTLSGSDVTAWDDLAAGDNDAVTPGFGGNPLFVATDASIAGHSSIEFDQAGGSGDGEALDAIAVGPLVTGPFTVSCTARIDSLTVFCALWSLHDAVGGAYIYNGTENSAIIHITSEDDAGATFASGAFTGIDSNWHVYTTVVTAPRVGAVAGTFAFYIDGVLKTMTDNTVEARLPFTYLKIGMSDGFALEGRIAEIAVYNEAFDATTVRQDAQWMAADKGITIP